MRPKEYVAFADAFARCREEARAAHRARHPDAGPTDGDGANIWIMKPVGLSRGRKL